MDIFNPDQRADGDDLTGDQRNPIAAAGGGILARGCPIARSNCGENDAAAPWIRRGCVGWVGLVFAFLIYSDPNVGIVGDGVCPRLVEQVSDCLSGVGKRSGSAQAVENRNKQSRQDTDDRNDANQLD